MGGIHETGHGFLIAFKGGLQQLFRCFERFHDIGPLAVLDSIDHLASHLFVRNVTFTLLPFIAEVSLKIELKPKRRTVNHFLKNHG